MLDGTGRPLDGVVVSELGIYIVIWKEAKEISFFLGYWMADEELVLKSGPAGEFFDAVEELGGRGVA